MELMEHEVGRLAVLAPTPESTWAYFSVREATAYDIRWVTKPEDPRVRPQQLGGQEALVAEYDTMEPTIRGGKTLSYTVYFPDAKAGLVLKYIPPECEAVARRMIESVRLRP